MRIITRCPNCGEEIQPTDTVCINCGADLIQAELSKKKELQEDSLAARRVAEVSGGDTAGGVAAGRAKPGETSEETRLRVFDQQEARRLAHERLSCYITAALVVFPALALLIFGILQVHKLGIAEIRTLTFADLRTWGAFSDPRILAAAATMLGLAGLLSFIGLTQRAVRASRAIREVKSGAKPTIVSLTAATYWGLLLTAVSCPPLGLIIGIALKFSSDEDIKNAAGTMIVISLVVIGVLLANTIPAVVETLQSSAPVKEASPTAP